MSDTRSQIGDRLCWRVWGRKDARDLDLRRMLVEMLGAFGWDGR